MNMFKFALLISAIGSLIGTIVAVRKERIYACVNIKR